MPRDTTETKPPAHKNVKRGKRKLPPKADMSTTYIIKRKEKTGHWREYGMKPIWKFVFNRKPEKKQKSQASKEKPGK